MKQTDECKQKWNFDKHSFLGTSNHSWMSHMCKWQAGLNGKHKPFWNKTINKIINIETHTWNQNTATAWEKCSGATLWQRHQPIMFGTGDESALVPKWQDALQASLSPTVMGAIMIYNVSGVNHGTMPHIFCPNQKEKKNCHYLMMWLLEDSTRILFI